MAPSMRQSTRTILILSLVTGCSSSYDREDAIGGGWGGSGGADDDIADAEFVTDTDPDPGGTSGDGHGGSGSDTSPDDDCVDGCEVEPMDPMLSVWAGGASTCIVMADTGDLMCWGRNDDGRLGYGHLENIGDDEVPADAGSVTMGSVVVDVAVGAQHTCALRDDHSVVCWGYDADGRLGYAPKETPEGEMPMALPAVDLGADVIQLAAGVSHTCALTDAGAVRCWGQGTRGRLGYGDVESIGDDESPSSAGDLSLGAAATQVTVGLHHSCALLEGGGVRCWGRGDQGQLGTASVDDVGDDEFPADFPPVGLTAPAVQISAGGEHTCAVLEGGFVQCWGRGDSGQLGYGHAERIGDDEEPWTAGFVELGAPALQVSAGNEHTCALLDNGRVRCWGNGDLGQLGYGNEDTVDDPRPPMETLNLGGKALEISAGGDHTCAAINTGGVVCWGSGAQGRLGYGNTNNVGDKNVPAAYGRIKVR
jgi:hypothetical protein